ncbi:MAG TPA: thioredoxin family protein [Pirellulaceae bacterium]|nr:thioredoxin family protein [Pirellulaceae bacterium]
MLRSILGSAAALGCIVLLAASSAPAAEAATSVGKQIASFSLEDYRGKAWSLADFKDSKALVVAFVGTECPLVANYAARLQTLADQYNAAGVAFLAIDSNQQDSLTELAHFARTHKIEFPVLRDAGNKVADAFGATRTPEVFLLNASRKVVYQGRIDDQFTYGRQKPKVEQSYLTTAIDELVAGKPISTPHAEAVGCHIGRILTPKANSDVTYSQQIARIFQDRCVQCHRDGEIGPFTLTSYDDVVGWAQMIREVVNEQRMPPWHANPRYGHFANDASLTAEEKSLINRWVDAGAPEGDEADLPPPREFTPGWQIGEPDAIFYMAEKPYNVPATGEVRYQYFMVDPGFTEDKWVKAAECRPGNRAVVHHIIVGLAAPGNQGRLKDLGGQHSEWLTATAPGARPLILRDGMAKLIPAGSKLVFQMHYTPNGTVTEDRSCVGLIFADPKEVTHIVATDKAATRRLDIPPQAENHHVESSHTFGSDQLMLAMFPHMHLRGKAFRYTAHYPDGKQEVLLDVPAYDFNWQNSYEFAEPKLMPKGTRLECDAWFNNSESNLANPDPTATVRWGDQTWEEMMIGYFDATPADGLKLPGTKNERTSQFAALLAEGKAKLNDELKALAAKSLESDQGLAAFGPQLRTIAPQLDRVCWTTIEDGKLVIRRCVQEPALEKIVGGAGRKVDLRLTKLATYAGETEPVVHQQLDAVRAFDLQFMSRAYASSLHIPVKIDGIAGTINFWSAEKDAFPPELVSLLQEAATAMAAR